MNMKKVRQMQNIVQNPGESEQIRAIAGAQAELERQQRDALEAALIATGYPDLSGLLEPLPDHEERVQQLCDALAAKLKNDPWGAWSAHYTPDALEAEAAAEYAAMKPGEWKQQRDRWAERYREMADVATEGMSDDELVTAHIRTTFGVEPETFESVVVRWRPAKLYERAVTGPMQEHRDVLEALAEAADAEDGGE